MNIEQGRWGDVKFKIGDTIEWEECALDMHGAFVVTSLNLYDHRNLLPKEVDMTDGEFFIKSVIPVKVLRVP